MGRAAAPVEVAMLGSEEQQARPVAPGMDVCDVSGEKVGTVARVHHPTSAQEVVEVKTGLLGLGQHLYVQSEQIDAVTDAGVILKHAKGEFHNAGLDARPDELTD
jgi:Uncharacterized protein conserved in bacteria (DUF2171)